MADLVAFLRGINVGGHHVTNQRLREVLTACGLEDVRTFIASGNVIIRDNATMPGALETEIERALGAALGYSVTTFVRTLTDLALLAHNDPFRELVDGRRYVTFLKFPPPPETEERVLALAGEGDTLAFDGCHLWWHARAGMADSAFARSPSERVLGAPMTVRNLNTVRRIVERFA